MNLHLFQESESGVKKKLEKASITLADCLACSGMLIKYREAYLDKLLVLGKAYSNWFQNYDKLIAITGIKSTPVHRTHHTYLIYFFNILTVVWCKQFLILACTIILDLDFFDTGIYSHLFRSL